MSTLEDLRVELAGVEEQITECDRLLGTMREEREQLAASRQEIRARMRALDGGDRGAISRYLERQKQQREQHAERKQQVAAVLESAGLKAEEITAETVAPDPIDRPKRKRQRGE